MAKLTEAEILKRLDELDAKTAAEIERLYSAGCSAQYTKTRLTTTPLRLINAVIACVA